MAYDPGTAGRFTEREGGEIIGPYGQPIAFVEVANLTTADAARAVRVILAALEAEFPAPPGKGGEV